MRLKLPESAHAPLVTSKRWQVIRSHCWNIPSGSVKIATERGPVEIVDFHWKWWFSPIMLVNQRVTGQRAMPHSTKHPSKSPGWEKPFQNAEFPDCQTSRWLGSSLAPYWQLLNREYLYIYGYGSIWIPPWLLSSLLTTAARSVGCQHLTWQDSCVSTGRCCSAYSLPRKKCACQGCGGKGQYSSNTTDESPEVSPKIGLRLGWIGNIPTTILLFWSLYLVYIWVPTLLVLEAMNFELSDTQLLPFFYT